MKVMAVFDTVILIFGAYMAAAALNMKKNGRISPAILAAEEIERCRDKQAFIAFMYWKEAVFGGVVLLVGAARLVNDLAVPLGALNTVGMVLFFAAFLWFQMELKKARTRFC